MYIICSLLSLN